MPELSRRRVRDETGFSTLELAITTALLGLSLSITFSALASAQQSVSRAQSRSASIDEVRLAMSDIDRQVRSSNRFFDPASEGANAGAGIAPGFSLRIYTQATGHQRCVQWRLTASGRLQTRRWTESWQADGQVSAWRTVASNLVNVTAPFALETGNGSAFGGRLMNVELVANNNRNAGADVRMRSSSAGRNIQYGYSANVCSPIPPA